jgi:hypothetical protein
MKRLGVVFIFSLLSVYCFGQSQTGEASYNTSKSGFTISHSSMSFGTRVRVINLANNSEVIATVDNRIPASDPRVADISREAGDAIGMAHTGYTMVRIEQLIPPQSAASPAPAPVPTPAPPVSAPPVQEPRQTPTPAPPPPQEPREEIIQVVTPSQVQYIPAPVIEQLNCPLSPVVIILLALVAALLAAILVLLICARRFPWWPGYPWWVWRYPPLVVRRRLRHLKKPSSRPH